MKKVTDIKVNHEDFYEETCNIERALALTKEYMALSDADANSEHGSELVYGIVQAAWAQSESMGRPTTRQFVCAKRLTSSSRKTLKRCFRITTRNGRTLFASGSMTGDTGTVGFTDRLGTPNIAV